MLTLLIPTALAYSLEGLAWPGDQLPLEVHWTGQLDSMSHDDLQSAVEGATGAWDEAMPCPYGVAAVEDADAQAWFEAGGVAVSFGGVGDGVEYESGGLTGDTFESNGATWNVAPAVDLLVPASASDSFVSDADIGSGECAEGQFSLQGMLTHDLGHVLGLGHSCDENEACTTTEEQSATMFWTLNSCDSGSSTLGRDDEAGISAIYSGGESGFDVACVADPEDGLTVECTVDASYDSSAEWDFGDGAAAEGASVEHTYAGEGTSRIRVCVSSPTCGEQVCENVYFFASGPDTGDPEPDEDEDDSTGGADSGCGCAATSGGSPGAGLAALVVGLSLGRRRRA